jgi:hypothetical protein
MTRAGLALLLAALIVLPAAAAGPPAGEQWIVVTAPDFRDAVAPLVKHRQKQGMLVVPIDVADVLSAKEICSGDGRKLRARLQKLWRDHPGRSYILLVGAIEAGDLPKPERCVVPALIGTISRMKGQPTDSAYGCPDGKRLPTIAVGRLPANTAAEAKAMVAKILAMENDSAPGLWKRRLTVLAGIPAYNPLMDQFVEKLAIGRFDRLDPAWSGRVVYSNPHSVFALADDKLRKQALDYLAEGQAFTLYLGHSSAEGLYGGPRVAFLDRKDWGRLTIPHGMVFITFGCNGCQLKGEDGEGYGVKAILNPNGPAAVMGSHGILFASMGILATDGLCQSAFQGRLPRRLGACWLALLNGIARGKIDFLTYRMLDSVDGDSKIPQATQRQEHLEMMVLLGDPALRLPEMPDDIHLQPVEAVSPGKTLTVKGRLPARLKGASVRLTLERSPGSQPVDLKPVPKKPADLRDRVMLDNHRLANRFIVAEKQANAKDIHFEIQLTIPKSLPKSKLHLRLYARNDKCEGMIVQRLSINDSRHPGGR